MTSDLELSQQLRASQDAPGLHACCEALTRVAGFEHFIYGLRIPVSLTEPYHFCISGYPRLWRERYDRLGYVRVDPIVRHVFNSSLPVVWDEIERHEPEVRDFFADAAEHGLHHGISVPVAGRRGDLGLFSLARRQPVTQEPAEREALKQRLLWFATVLHDAVRKLVLTRDGVPLVSAPLGDREKDCLMWAADGRTTAEIARQMGITERTVLFHLESAGRKLGASGRHNILARAVALGEIDLNMRALQSSGQVPVMHEPKA